MLNLFLGLLSTAARLGGAPHSALQPSGLAEGKPRSPGDTHPDMSIPRRQRNCSKGAVDFGVVGELDYF